MRGILILCPASLSQCLNQASTEGSHVFGVQGVQGVMGGSPRAYWFHEISWKIPSTNWEWLGSSPSLGKLDLLGMNVHNSQLIASFHQAFSSAMAQFIGFMAGDPENQLNLSNKDRIRIGYFLVNLVNLHQFTWETMIPPVVFFSKKVESVE